jgi:hypothetical protein
MQPRGRLPTQFVSEFGYQIGRRVVLHDPNGNQIEVSVKKEYGDIFFKYGPPWQHPMIDGSTKHVLFKELIFVSHFLLARTLLSTGGIMLWTFICCLLFIFLVQVI